MKLNNEISLWVIMLLPFAYLMYIWNTLPARVPMHWNIKGEIDRYGSKMELFFLILLMPVFIYLILWFAPKIDPKKKIDQMGIKYDRIRLLMLIFISVINFYVIYSVQHRSIGNPNFILLLVGMLYAVLGNYFKTIKSNYFVGIRTPWTLENEQVWKETHRLGGILWFVGGLSIVVASLVLDSRVNFIYFMTVTVIIALIPIVFSYLRYKNLQNEG